MKVSWEVLMARSRAAVARRAHNPKVTGSNPVSATTEFTKNLGPLASGFLM